MTAGASKLAAERGYVYSLLSTVFRQPLDNGRLESLRAPGMLAAMKAAGVDPGADFINGDSAGLLEKLAVEYTQLFHGPGQHITPFEGMIADGDDELMGKAYVAVRVFMADIGFSVPPENGELADHLSVELAFLAELCAREAEALSDGDQKTADFAACMQKKFLTAHTGRWATPFAEQVKQRTELPFYAAMAGFLADFVGEEARAEAA